MGVAKQGYTLAGAGGGGFILLVTKKPNDRPHPTFPDRSCAGEWLTEEPWLRRCKPAGRAG